MHVNAEIQKTPTKVFLMGIPSGKAGIVETLKIMSRLTNNGKKSFVVRQTALSLLDDVLQKDYRNEIKRLFDFVKNNIRYVRDIRNIETLHTPEKILEFKSGDCDDKSVLLASMLESIGHKTRFVACGKEPGVYEHVYVEVWFNNQWLPLETTEPVNMGWKAPLKARLIKHNG